MKFRLGVVLLILVSVVSSMQFNEKISISGIGGLSARTDAVAGSDDLNANGEQEYSRAFSIAEDSSNLKTSYICKNISARIPAFYNNTDNYYYVHGKSPVNSEHSLRISSNHSIESAATIDSSGDSFSTNFEMKSGYGNVTELLSEKIGARTVYRAQSEIMGNLTLSSSANEDVKIWAGYEVDQMQKLSEVKSLGDPGVYETLTFGTGYKKTTADIAWDLIKMADNESSYEKALDYCDRAIELDPGPDIEAWAWYTKGNVRYDQEFFIEAAKAYDRAIQKNPELREAWLSKAKALSSSNNTPEALNVLNKATEKFKDYYEAWVAKGLCLKDMGKLDEALSAAETAIRINSEMGGEAYLLKGIIVYNKISSGDCNGSCCNEARNAIAISISLNVTGDDSVATSYLQKLDNLTLCKTANPVKPEEDARRIMPASISGNSSQEAPQNA
jgi:tetratricopeptide (TPR) repeat protein